MVNPQTIRNVTGIIGNVLSLLFYVAPLEMMVKIFKQGSMGEFDPFTFLAIVFSSFSWILYELIKRKNMMNIIVNMIGFFMAHSYVLFFKAFVRAGRRGWVTRWVIDVVLLIESLIPVVIMVITLLLKTLDQKKTFLGVVTGVAANIMYVSQIVTLIKVVRKKNVQGMCTALSFATFANSTCWVVYSMYPVDLILLSANVLGVATGAGQILVYLIYRKKVPPAV